jgi:hypothetical protein
MLQFTVKWSLGSVYLYLEMVRKPHALYLDSTRECFSNTLDRFCCQILKSTGTFG